MEAGSGSISGKSKQESDFKLEDKLLYYTHTLLDENKLLDDDNIKLMDTYNGSLLLDGEVSKPYSIDADAPCNVDGESQKSTFKLTSDGADFRFEDEDEDEDGDENNGNDDDYTQDTPSKNDTRTEMPSDLYSYSHSAGTMDSDSPNDACDLLCTVGLSAEWDKETSSASSTEEKEEEFNPYTFIKNLPSMAYPPHDSTPLVLLPPLLPTDPLFTLVLDLDETLVHCSTESLAHPDLVFPVTFNSIEYTVWFFSFLILVA
jgi:hypothetical protein